jgi:hypothetical protein
MTSHTKRRLFDRCRKSLAAAGIAVPEQAILCPLCWQQKLLDELTVDHVVSESLGGKKTTLTCCRCNNTYGSSLESDLQALHKACRFWKGGQQLAGELRIEQDRAAVKVQRGSSGSGMHVKVVAKASNPAQITSMEHRVQSGEVQQLQLRLSYGYKSQRAIIALVRCAYLALFRCFGYEYACDRFVQELRKAMANSVSARAQEGERYETSLVLLKPLVVGLSDCNWPFSCAYVIAPGRLAWKDKHQGADFFFVLFRWPSSIGDTRYGVFMPQPGQSEEAFLGPLRQAAAEHASVRLGPVPVGLLFC